MTIQIELNPEMEAQLAAAAQMQGLALESYAGRLLQEALASRSGSEARASEEEFRNFLDSLARNVPEAYSPRDETFSREMIYGEHD
ncbi:hypothetical protein [Granulicella arctica]|uniref:hypothetical protein n=1 Tax=Granulicella arctica TaxID=940613 RepID=UPI0021E0F30F|nr:hypothetical protein [Granulicella arctica]